MTQKWNLQDIRPAGSRKKRVSKQRPESLSLKDNVETEPIIAEREDIPSVVIEDGNKKSYTRLIVSIVLFVVIISGAIILSATMGKTELTIYPKHKQPNVSATFVAFPNKRENSLSYEIMKLESTGETQVKASGQVQVQEQATGMLEIRKTTPGAERLIKNTRFRTPGGLVFRIQESVVVPGAVNDETGVMGPGTIQAKVFADEVGEEYNIPANVELDVPGFEEGGYTALYNAISATNPEPFTGGFDGPQFQIEETELNTARQALQVELRDNLLLRLDEKPAGFIAFPGAVTITYSQLPSVEYGQDLVTIRENAVMQIPLFNAIEFGSYLARETVATYEGNPVRVDDPEVLTFSYTSPTTSSSVIANEPSLSFNLNGKPKLIWEYDAKALTEDLAGLSKTAVNNILGDSGAYPGIQGAKVHITPFWKRSFPDNAEEIIVIEELKDPAESTDD